MLPGSPSWRARISPSRAASASSSGSLGWNGGGRLGRVAHRADRPAVAAAGALGGVHAARPLAHLGHEMARLALQRGHVGHRQHVDVVVAHALDQFRRDDAGGAVAGGEGLVEAGHAAADRRAFLDQVDAEPGRREIQRGLDAGDAAAAHQHRPARRLPLPLPLPLPLAATAVAVALLRVMVFLPRRRPRRAALGQQRVGADASGRRGPIPSGESPKASPRSCVMYRTGVGGMRRGPWPRRPGAGRGSPGTRGRRPTRHSAPA